MAKKSVIITVQYAWGTKDHKSVYVDRKWCLVKNGPNSYQLFYIATQQWVMVINGLARAKHACTRWNDAPYDVELVNTLPADTVERKAIQDFYNTIQAEIDTISLETKE